MVTVLCIEDQPRDLRDVRKLDWNLIIVVPEFQIRAFSVDARDLERISCPKLDWLEKTLRLLKKTEPLLSGAVGKELRFNVGKLVFNFAPNDPQQYRTNSRIYLLSTRQVIAQVIGEAQIIDERLPFSR